MGGNISDRFMNMEKAREMVSQKIGVIEKQSGLYETAPWGNTRQPEFLNQVLKVHTRLKPFQVLRKTQEIEMELGRVRYEKWGERIMDIDILFFNDQVIESRELTVPHPRIQDRRFTLVPLAEITNGFVHPKLKKNIKTLLNFCPDKLAVKAVESSFKRVEL